MKKTLDFWKGQALLVDFISLLLLKSEEKNKNIFKGPE